MFDGSYFDWNQKRIKAIIDHYGHHFFINKKILDLGCGYADISGVLYRLGSVITAVDSRQEHLKIVSKKYPGIQTVKSDLDRGWPFYGKTFDITLNLGLLCHLSEYEVHLKTLCASTEFLVLETAVCDSLDPNYCIAVQDSKSNYDGSANGVSLRVSTAAIERVLQESGMKFQRIDNSKFNSGPYVYDWQPKHDNSFNINKRRIWFAVKGTNPIQITLPVLDNVILSPTNNILQNSNIPVIAKPVISHKPTGASVNLPISKTQFVDVIPHDTYIANNSEKKKIKTALCISGHLRTFQSNFKSVYDNLISQLDCDVFIHTWDTLGMPYRGMDNNVHNIKTLEIKSKIDEMYSPKKFIIEPPRSFIITPIMKKRQVDHRDIPGILSMYYKIEACNKLKSDYENENNFKYDCVIRFRGDLFLEQAFPINYNTNFEHIYIPMFGNFGGLNDQLAFGSSSVMDIYSSLYSNIEHHLNSGAILNPEKLLNFHIEINKLSVAKFNFQYVIKRSNGLIQNNMLLEKAWGFLK